MKINPFNPQIPARPDFFVGREPEIIEFEKFLRQTVGGSPMNMSITGNRGMGKTSLLVKFEQIAKQEQCLVIRLSNYEGNVTNILDFSDFVSANLKTELLSTRPLKKGLSTFKDLIVSLKPQIEWNDIVLSVEKKQVIEKLFRQRLNTLWDEIKKDYKAAVILIDEAESLEKIEGVLQFLREVFQRLATESNYMVVLAGKLNFAERMSESFSPLNRFFPVHRLNEFIHSEIEVYITKKFDTVSVEVEDDAISLIAEESEGHPYVLVILCYGIFDSLLQNETIITKDVVKRSLPKVYAALEKDFFSPMFHPLTPKAKEILKLIANKITSTCFSFSEAVKLTGIEKNYLSPYLQEILRKGIINKPERGQYKFFHKLFLRYAKSA